MLSWLTSTAQSTLSAVAGTAEPIYGPEAIHPVSLQENENPKYETDSDDLKWLALEETSVETQTFYIEGNSGHFVIAQAVYSNVMGLHLTTQFNVKVFCPDGKVVWSAATLLDQGFSENQKDFYAENLSITLSDDGKTYTIKSAADAEVMVNLTIENVAPGFKVGKDGKTHYGTDRENPWGSMRHIFWPRAKSDGVVIVGEDTIDCAGRAVFIMALQGMKPHHAAARWKFLAFHGEKYSAIMMEFTTPPSYGSTIVNVSGIVSDEKLIAAGTTGTFEHPEVVHDEETTWDEPKRIKASFKGMALDGKPLDAVSDLTLENRVDRVDIMAQVPVVIKKVLAGTVGTRPYIYQYRQKTSFELKIGDETVKDEGQMFSEATFIV